MKIRPFFLAALLAGTVSPLAAQTAPQPGPTQNMTPTPYNAGGLQQIITTGTTAGTAAAGNDRRLDGSTFYAPSFGSCTWDATHDVGPCIQLAQAAAAVAGGGTIEIPAGSFGLATALTASTRGVHFHGMGVGDARDNFSPNSFQAVTRLVWIGAAGATMFDEEPVNTSVMSLYSANVEGITFDCASLANICFKLSQTSHSTIKIGVAEPRSIGAYLSTTTTTDAPGTQDNDFWITSRSTNAAYSPTGILIDGGQGSNTNVSYDRFWHLFAWYYNGDGIVFGSSDNNLIADINTFRQPGGTGSPVIFATPGYVMPNGIATSSLPPYTTRVLHTGAAVTVQGYTQGSVLTASPSNTGTAAVTPVVASTTVSAGNGAQTLTFASTTGIASGENIRCGSGSNSGIINDDSVASASAGTVVLNFPAIGTVASGTSCTFSYGFNATAVAGTYTITAATTSTFNITAPAGGNTQSGVALSGGVISATDLTIPMTGTPAVGDTWTIVAAQPPTDILIEGVDKANANPNPHFGPGATGGYTTSTNRYPAQGNARGGINMFFGSEACSGKIPAVGPIAINIGGCGGAGATGTYATNIGGVGNAVSGFGGAAFGGTNVTVSGIYASGFGQNTTASGQNSQAAGFFSSDRGAFAKQVFAGGRFSAAGDAQFGNTVLRGTGASTSAIRLTADAAAAGSTNCVNIADGTAYNLSISLVIRDVTTPANSLSYTLPVATLLRGTGAASTTLTLGTPATVATNAWAPTVSATADTTNGCLNLSVTPPAANTDTVHAVANVQTAEGQ